MSCVPHIEVFVDFSDMEGSLHKVIEKVRPDWAGKKLVIEPVPGGNLNKNLRVCPADAQSFSIFAHVINPIAAPMIPNHLKVCRLLSQQKIGPDLYATFSNGTVTEMLSGKDLETMGRRDLLREPDLMRRSAHELARIHADDLTAKAKEHGIETIESEMMKMLAKMHWTGIVKNESMPAALREVLPDAESLCAELDRTTEIVEALGENLTLCHNDYNPANMMLTDDNKFVVIDFDGTMLGHPSWDIAYFFFFTFNNHFSPGERIEEADEKFILSWCRAYLESRASLDGEPAPTDTQVRKLVFCVRKALLSIYVRTTLTSGLLSFMGHAASEGQKLNFLQFATHCWAKYQASKATTTAMTFTE